MVRERSANQLVCQKEGKLWQILYVHPAEGETKVHHLTFFSHITVDSKQKKLTSESSAARMDKNIVNPPDGKSAPKACRNGRRKYDPGRMRQASGPRPGTRRNAEGEGLK